MSDYISYLVQLLDYRKVKTLKQLGNSPNNLTKTTYIEILQNITNYVMSDKIDGFHCFIIYNYGRYAYITGKESIDLPDIVQLPNIQVLVLEAEMYEDIFYVYDILRINITQTWKEPYSVRYAKLKELEDVLKKTLKIKIKEFITLSSDYANEIPKFHTKTTLQKYPTDGLIFTETDKPFNKQMTYKWKPIDHLTIDFLTIKNSSNKTVLCCGISNDMFVNLGLSFPVDYMEKYIKYYRPFYFAIPFTPSTNPNACYYEGNIPINTIVEMKYNVKESKWFFNRERTDRITEVKTGKYYGNDFKIAEEVWQTLHNPLLLQDLCKTVEVLSSEVYFVKSDDTYADVRKFNNSVKRMLINQFAGKVAIDLASGKGQDLLKYYSNNISTLMIEYDKTALDELISRKYNLKGKTMEIRNIKEYKPVNPITYALNMDLTLDSSTIINSISKYPNYTKNLIPIIVCNLALHYFLNNEKDYLNITTVIAYFLTIKGVFLFTAFDGELIFNLLKKKNYKNDKYSITKMYSDETLTCGQKIDVLLPCTNLPVKENLINLKLLDKYFLKFGIVRSEEGNFGKFPNNLNTIDSEFVKLYHYVIYKKIT